MNANDLAAAGSVTSAVGAEIVVAAERAAGIITLNRPGALNALTSAMRASIAEAVPRWARDPEIYAVIVASATDRAFCAGGDVRELTQSGRSHMAEARASLAAEYALNWTLECFSKPTISLIDGLAMGLGVGISLYGTHRVGGERYRFAMPETGIGLFPDDGLGWVFARMPDQIGMYLALTGRPLGRADAYHLGLVTHCIPARRFDEIRAEISAAEPVDQVLDGRHEDPGAGEFEHLKPAIARCFGADSVEATIERLRAEPGETAAWAEGVVKDLQKRSPTSLKITHRHVRQSRDLDLRTTLINDFRLACRCLEGHDLYEGVRASLIDRDQAPKWRPERLEDVSETMVDAYFAQLGSDELQLASRAEMQAFRR